MKFALSFLSLLALGCFALACSRPVALESGRPAEPSKHPLVGEYQYTGYDKSGGKLVEGRLSITSVEPRRIGSEESIQIKGNWQFQKVGSQERIGAQVGSGELIGGILDGEIHIDLNPNISDSNVLLTGKLDGKRFHGSWAFRGYAGTLNEGTFEAIRK